MSKKISSLSIGGFDIPVVNNITSNAVYGYYITSFDTTNNTITISTTEDGTGLPDADILERWLEPTTTITGEEITNQYVSFDATGFYALSSKILDYDSSTGTITVDKLPTDSSNFDPTIPSEREDNTEYVIYAPFTPDAGEVLLFSDQIQQNEGLATGYGSVGINRSHGAGPYSFAANRKTIAGYGAASFGMNTEAWAQYSLVQGRGCITEENAKYSTAQGGFTVCTEPYQHVEGKYNYLDENGSSGADFVHIVGWGSSSNRKNIYTLDTSGNAVFAGSIDSGTIKSSGNITATNITASTRIEAPEVKITSKVAATAAKVTNTLTAATVKATNLTFKNVAYTPIQFEITYEGEDEPRYINVIGAEV